MKIVIKIAAVALLTFGAVSCSEAQSTSASSPEQTVAVTQNVNVTEFKALVDAGKGTLLDVRTAGEVSQGKIAGATHIDFYSSDFSVRVAKLDKTKPVYVYCASGGRSGGAMRKMKKMGFLSIYNLSGGIGSWKRKGFPIK